jgi:hypothetical protein
MSDLPSLQRSHGQFSPHRYRCCVSVNPPHAHARGVISLSLGCQRVTSSHLPDVERIVEDPLAAIAVAVDGRADLAARALGIFRRLERLVVGDTVRPTR